MIDILLEEPINCINEIMNNNYPVEGFTVSIAVNNINAKLYGGNKSYKGSPITPDTMFDVASVTKFYTQIIACNLINDGYYKLSDKIVNLDDRFKNLEGLTVQDILTFTAKFHTDGRIADMSSSEEAFKTLYNAHLDEIGTYNYNDIGMMIIKEISEKITGMSYDELFKKYITDKLSLKNTHIIVPKNKIHMLTGSPNIEIGKVNDPVANILGGYSGHAGVFTSSDDLIKLGQASFDDKIIPEQFQQNMYTPGIKSNRGIMGNTFVTTEKGTDDSFSDRLDSSMAFSVQGSTRAQMNAGKYILDRNEYINASTILLNPSSISIERAKEQEKIINLAREEKGLNPLSLVKHFMANVNGDLIEYDLIDPRQMLTGSMGINKLIASNVKTQLKIMLLLEIIKEYESEYKENINIAKHI